jgi:hypothetical protein
VASWIKDVTKQHVPLSKPAPFRVPWWSEKIGKLVEEERKAFRRCRWDKSQLAKEEYRVAKKAKGAAIKAAKRRSFEEALEKASSEGEKSIWHLAKWLSPKISFLLPPLLFLTSQHQLAQPQPQKPYVKC